MDKRTEDYFKSILSEESPDYDHLPKFATSSVGKFKYYVSQFKDINYKEKASNFIVWIKGLSASLSTLLAKKIEKPKPVETTTEKPKETVAEAPIKPVEPVEPVVPEEKPTDVTKPFELATPLAESVIPPPAPEVKPEPKLPEPAEPAPEEVTVKPKKVTKPKKVSKKDPQDSALEQ